ncbi:MULTISPECIES: hypothetical protein [unclassified Streptomyces]|uniref:hypothetical protein n=1 Tax=unclassified Streptomyces TaxID=2593676 RepID=UPI0029A2B631|nr:MULTISPECIES: hypothetical protein [unclassified Streptomyces]MDX3767869.1 hypothetical protein [Streptomyces sp. AK08-01B]MDX3818096.1 hypothetical protein [Streptomyces sp. AK08-01A]
MYAVVLLEEAAPVSARGQGLTVTTRVPTSLGDRLHFHADKLDGVGPGYYADGGQLPQISDERNRVVAAMNEIDNPVASAVVHWRTAEQGGRLSGAPTVPVYMATAVFVLGDDTEVQSGWRQRTS